MSSSLRTLLRYERRILEYFFYILQNDYARKFRMSKTFAFSRTLLLSDYFFLPLDYSYRDSRVYTGQDQCQSSRYTFVRREYRFLRNVRTAVRRSDCVIDDVYQWKISNQRTLPSIRSRYRERARHRGATTLFALETLLALLVSRAFFVPRDGQPFSPPLFSGRTDNPSI